jgi:hypothetical protein
MVTIPCHSSRNSRRAISRAARIYPCAHIRRSAQFCRCANWRAVYSRRMSTSAERMRRMRARRAAALLPAGGQAPRDADDLLAPAVEETLAALGLGDGDAAVAQLARRYAKVIDQARDPVYAMRWVAPLLLDCLVSIGATPMAQARLQPGCRGWIRCGPRGQQSSRCDGRSSAPVPAHPGRSSPGLTALMGAGPGQNLRSGALIGHGRTGTTTRSRRAERLSHRSSPSRRPTDCGARGDGQRASPFRRSGHGKHCRRHQLPGGWTSRRRTQRWF